MKFLYVFTFCILGIVLAGLIVKSHYAKPVTSTKIHTVSKAQVSITLSPVHDEPFGNYVQPTIGKKEVYRIDMVGDSMTHALGIHGGKLSEYLNMLYQSIPGHQHIIIDNYAIGSKNILDLHNQMTQKLTSDGLTLAPLVSMQPDVILIESFGYNPLSQFGLIDGQKKQTQVLDDTMKFLKTTLPNTAIVFVATIAPNKETYAQNENQGSAVSDREAQAQERMAYIKNHMAYAASHNIPVIDIYDKSLTKDGDGNMTYINPTDHIHPSFAGIDFISHEIANFIYQSQILPK